ncbi:MAG: hypothetical protein K6B72_13055 [Lachnospiraceae bacterium]|nr:hypothetical protein [Lachnospiraceae bacterium]
MKKKIKKYEIENNDYGPNYILHFEDDTYAMVNLEVEEVYFDDPADLMHMGFWADDDMEPVSRETRAKIDEILQKG